MDLTSRPLSPWKPTPRHIMECRIALAKSADLLRMEQKYCAAEKLYRRASRYAEGGAADHLVRLADHCRQTFERIKRKKNGVRQ